LRRWIANPVAQRSLLAEAALDILDFILSSNGAQLNIPLQVDLFNLFSKKGEQGRRAGDISL
jgi:hypothetical protein